MKSFKRMMVVCFLSACGNVSYAADDLLEVKGVQLTLIEQVQVPANDQGVLQSFTVREGQMVKQGDEFGKLESVEEELNVQRASLELEIATDQAKNDVKVLLAKKSHQVAQAELKRAEESVRKFAKSVSATEMDRLRLIAERAELEIKQATIDQKTAKLTQKLKENELNLAKQILSRKKIKAPISGMVVEIHHRKGEWVQPGETVLRLVRIDRLRVEGFLQIEQIQTNLVGKFTTLSVKLPGKAAQQFQGEITFLSPEINPVNGQVRFWAEVKNGDLHLRPGMEGDLEIHLNSPSQVSKKN